jgi:putative addiction module component (TIGR02574 family)
MADYHDILASASQLSVDERLRLIDDLASSMPDDRPSNLPPEWMAEICRRSEAVDSGSVQTESWSDIRDRLLAKHGIRDAN